MTYKAIEEIVNEATNQIIFTNGLGNIEYHPERFDFITKFFYLKHFVEYEFDREYSFDTDLASLEYYEDLKKVIDNVEIKPEHFSEWEQIKGYIYNKVEFEKQRYMKRDNYSLTDAYLAGLLDKITEWLDNKGIDSLMTVLAKTGEEIGNKDIQ